MVTRVTTTINKRTVILTKRLKGTLKQELRKLQAANRLPVCKLSLPTGYLSVSQVLTYMRCPMQYYWRYVKGITNPPMAKMTEGRAMHKALEVGHKEQRRIDKSPPLDVFLDAYRDAWTEMKREIEDWGDEDENGIMHRDRCLLSEYREVLVPKMNPEQIESRFWSPFGKADIPVVGFVDLIDYDKEKNEHWIIDHKIVAKTKSQKEVDSDLQLTVYSHAHATPGVQFTSFVKTKKPKISAVQSTRTQRDGLWAEKVFAEVANGISAGYFPPCDPSSWSCTKKWCGYAFRCRFEGQSQ